MLQTVTETPMLDAGPRHGDDVPAEMAELYDAGQARVGSLGRDADDRELLIHGLRTQFEMAFYWGWEFAQRNAPQYPVSA